MATGVALGVVMGWFSPLRERTMVHDLTEAPVPSGPEDDPITKRLFPDRRSSVGVYAGAQDEGYRNETGTVFRHPEKVLEIVQIAQQELSS